MRKISYALIPGVILAVGGLIAILVRAREGVADGGLSVTDNVVIAVASIGSVVILVSLMVSGLARPNVKRQRYLTTRFPDARVAVVRLHDDLLAGIAIVTDQDIHAKLESQARHYVSVVAEDSGISFWAGGQAPVELGRLDWSRIADATTGTWVADGRDFECVVIEVETERGSIKLPLELVGRGLRGLYPQHHAEIVEYSRGVRARTRKP